MSTLDETGELTCPRCGVTVVDELEGVDASIDGSIRLPIDCPDCDAPLAIVLESALPTALGIDAWIEDRREE